MDVIAVDGTCALERSRCARRLARSTGRTLIPALGAGAADVADLLAARLEQPAGLHRVGSGAVLELTGDTDPQELIGALSGEGQPVRLRAVVCVVDALHVLEDLACAQDVPGASSHGETVARAQLTARQLECASTVLLVQWRRLEAQRLATVLAVIAHLAPQARVRMVGAGVAGVEDPESLGDGAVDALAPSRAGWVGLLNREHRPPLTDIRVSAVRYEQLRPAHPQRLYRVLAEQIGAGEFGTVLRSGGFCRLASRADRLAQWDQAGPVIALSPLPGAPQDDPGADELALVGQEIGLIGLDLDRRGLTQALDAAALTDAELAEGPAAWAEYPDPFPVWPALPR